MSFHSATYIAPLLSAFEEIGDSEKAKAMNAYLKHQFSFYGVMTTERRATLKYFYKTQPKLTWSQAKEVAFELWQKSNRECHYCAIEFLAFYKNEFDEDFIVLIEQLIIKNSWWDTVDHVIGQLIFPYLKKYPTIMYAKAGIWNKSENIWLQRSSIIFQLKQKDKVDVKIMEKHILYCSKSKEFFVQKAIGWMLREYAKTHALWVLNFVDKYPLAPLSKREASKHLT